MYIFCTLGTIEKQSKILCTTWKYMYCSMYCSAFAVMRGHTLRSHPKSYKLEQPCTDHMGFHQFLIHG